VVGSSARDCARAAGKTAITVGLFLFAAPVERRAPAVATAVPDRARQERTSDFICASAQQECVRLKSATDGSVIACTRSVISPAVIITLKGERPMIITRRDAVASLAVFAELLRSRDTLAQSSTPASAASAQTPPRPPVFVQSLPNITMDDWQVTVSEVDYAPGRVGAAHQHPGFVLAYVLEGSVVAKISGQGEEKVYTKGQMFYEQPGATHEVSRNASQTVPAKLLALIFAKKGATLTKTVGG
jgi:quercetin dioxygenase-like cupin family protein